MFGIPSKCQKILQMNVFKCILDVGCKWIVYRNSQKSSLKFSSAEILAQCELENYMENLWTIWQFHGKILFLGWLTRQRHEQNSKLKAIVEKYAYKACGKQFHEKNPIFKMLKRFPNIKKILAWTSNWILAWTQSKVDFFMKNL